jgi:uncharacterized protein
VLGRLSHARRSAMLYDYVLGEFSGVDVIVFGHSHEPYIKMHDGVLLFNPGSIVVRNGQPGTMGLLEISDRAIKGRILPVAEF